VPRLRRVCENLAVTIGVRMGADHPTLADITRRSFSVRLNLQPRARRVFLDFGTMLSHIHT
jgi:hypothetical protein